MSYKTKFFEWDVSPNPDQIGVPVGYEFEFRRQSGGYPILYNLSTFRENAVDGAFFYSFDGATFIPFPLGEKGFKFYTDYTMRVKITDAMSENIFALSDGVLYRLSGDGSKVIERLDTGIDLPFISIDHTRNDIYSYYENTLFCFYTSDTIRLKRSFNLRSEALEIIVDGARSVFWQISAEEVLKRSLVDAQILGTYSLGSTIVGSVKKFLDKKSGNIIFSAETGSGFEIFELDFYSGSVSSDTSSNLILDVDRGESGYFVAFGNQYIGEFLSGTLDETYIDTGRVDVSNVSGDLDVFYLADRDANQIVKFTLPYTEEWEANDEIANSSDLRVRGNDTSVVYAGGGRIICYRDGGIDLRPTPISGAEIDLEIGGQAKASHTVFNYRAVYGEAALDQSSSSSSDSSSSSSLDSSSSSSELYSSSSLSESEASASTESSSLSTPSSDSSGSSSSSFLFSESSSSSEGFSQSSSSSEGFSQSSSSSEGFSQSSSTSSENFSESSSSFDPMSESSSSSESAAVDPPPASIVCPGVSPSVAEDPPPDIILSVMGHSSSVDWCGETWLVGEQGTQKRVCPTSYQRAFGYAGPPNAFQHRWSHVGNNTSLRMMRYAYFGSFFPPRNDYSKNSLTLHRDGSLSSLRDGMTNLLFFSPSNQNLTQSDLGLLALGAPSTVYSPSSGGLLTDDFFGSHDIGGIVYKWSRGDNWPA